jgi:hypothetical protein
MALPSTQGVLNPLLNIIEPEPAGSWTALTSWGSAANWNPSATTIEWPAQILDLPRGSCAIEIVTEAAGDVEYEIWVSPSGAFDGDEVITTIEQGDEDIPAFEGVSAIIVIKVTNTNGLPQIFDMRARATNQSRVIRINSLNTSTLAGTVNARTLDLGFTISGITNIQITPKSVTNYTLAVYSTDYPTSNVVIPVVVDKTVPSIRLVGLDNVPRDGVIDVVAEALPEQYMSGNNLLLR